MDRQTLCDWVRRHNGSGVDGLKSRKSPGKAPRLTKEQKAEVYDLVVKDPDPAVNKVVRWRCEDLRAEVARHWSVEVHESTIGKWLGETVLLCHELLMTCGSLQHGHRGSTLAMARAIAVRMQVIEFGAWRSGLIGDHPRGR